METNLEIVSGHHFLNGFCSLRKWRFIFLKSGSSKVMRCSEVYVLLLHFGRVEFYCTVSSRDIYRRDFSKCSIF